MAQIDRNFAVETGDQNVYLIDGPNLMALCGDDGTIDGCHPNDFGFVSMAKAIGDKLEEIFAHNEEKEIKRGQTARRI